MGPGPYPRDYALNRLDPWFECRGAPGIAEDVTKLGKVLMNNERPLKVKSCDPKLARITNLPIYCR